MKERKKLLEILVGLERPIEQIRTALANISWDSEKEIVFLSLAHIKNVLNRYLADKVTESDIENWANFIEGRDDIGFEQPNAELLRELIHELANPSLTQPLTRKRAEELCKLTKR